jgi:SulP family sulfate permease
MTDTRGRPNKESFAQGAANIITGFFGGMGGCAMIGQSMININNGAVKRLSGIATAIFLASFVLFLSKWIEMIPLAALIGVMFVVAEKTFEWASLRLFGKIPVKDVFVGLLVGAVTIIADLAIAVILGVIVSALIFAWEHAKVIEVTASKDTKGWKIYSLKGTLFFASIKNFNELFDIKEDPSEIVIDFSQSKVADHSALMAISNLAKKYKLEGKKLHLINISSDCLEVIEDAKQMVDINVLKDDKYRLAETRSKLLDKLKEQNIN